MTGLWPSCYAAWFVAGFCIVRLDFVSDTAQHPLESRIGVWGCYVYRRLLVVLVALLYCTSARAADLRLSLTELSSLVNPILTGTSLRLHNVPSEGIFGGLFDPTKKSYIRFGGTEVELAFPVVKFPLTGIGNGQYAYYLNDIASTKIEVTPTASALVLAISFENDGAELVSSCYSGTCGFAESLPVVHWRRPKIKLHLKPSRYETGITLTASKVVVGGYFKTVCRSGRLFCYLGQSSADNYVNRLRKRYLPAQILKQINSDANRETIAAQLTPYLKLGTAGQISIDRVAVSDGSVRVRFTLP
ncbi:MAG: hypothetical protein ACI89J_001393 [Hyphomicrobiaceae bacterium]|jgi:hypothetical protein